MSEEKLEVLKLKSKRDIFKFTGENPSAINLEYVTMIKLSGQKIEFTFQTNGLSVDFPNEEAAKNVFEQIINVWAVDVVA
jgi:hypothetical protein